MYLLYTVKRHDSNTDGSFSMADLKSILSPLEILPIAKEMKYLGIFLANFLISS